MNPERDYLAETPPGIVAVIGIAYIGENDFDADGVAFERMKAAIHPAVIRASDPSDLALKLSHYAMDATISAGMPQPGTLTLALEVAMRNGATAEEAAQGVMKDRRDR